MALNEREGCQDPLGARCLGQAQAEGGRPEHLLWMLYFMKVYPKQGPSCSVVGTSAGAVNPKTHRKWVLVYIKAIAKLVDMVVSLLYFFAFVYCLLSMATASKGHRHRRMPLPSTGCCCHMPLLSTVVISRQPPPPRRHPQILFNNPKKGGILNTCPMTVDGTDFRVPQKGMATRMHLLPTSTRGNPPPATSWV
jgi:hypothetical protein